MDIPYEIDKYNRTKRQEGEPVMTQRRLAELAGVREESVSRQAQGYFQIAPATLAAYRRVLRIDEAAA